MVMNRYIKDLLAIEDGQQDDDDMRLIVDEGKFSFEISLEEMEDVCLLDDDDLRSMQSSLSSLSSSESYTTASTTTTSMTNLSIAEVQRRRRQHRMEVIRNKRLRKTTTVAVLPSSSAVVTTLLPETYTAVLSSSSVASLTYSSSSVLKSTDVSDPVLRRKLRNRESAERSRQKVNNLVDTLTTQLCASYAKERELTQTLQIKQSAHSNQATQAFHNNNKVLPCVEVNPFEMEDDVDVSSSSSYSDEYSLSDITSSSSMSSGSSSPAVDYMDYTGISNIDWNIQDDSLQEWLLLNSL